MLSIYLGIKKIILGNKISVALTTLMICGFALRFWHLGEQSLWIDEGFTLNGAMAIVSKGLPILDSGAFYWNGILETYIVAFLLKIFQFDPFNPWIARIPSVISGTLLILATFYLYKELFKRESGAVLSALIICFSYWHIAWSRQIRGYALATLATTVAIYLLIRYIKFPAKHKYLWGALCLQILGIFSQQITAAFLPILITGLVLKEKLLFFIEEKRKPFFISIGAIFCLGGLVYLKALGLFPSGVSIYPFFYFMPKELLFSLIITLVGIFYVPFFKNKDTPYFFFIAFLTLTAFVVILLFAPAIHLRYLFPLLPFAIVCAVYVLDSFFDFSLEKYSSNKRHFLSFCTILLFFIPFLQFNPISKYHLEWGAPQPNFSKAFEIIKSLKTNDDLVISAYPHLHKIYLGEKGYWLKMRLSEIEADIDKKLVNGKEYYLDAPILDNIDQLKSLIEAGNRGFVVIDSMSTKRITSLIKYLENSSRIERIFEEVDKEDVSSIYLYRFN